MITNEQIEIIRKLVGIYAAKGFVPDALRAAIDTLEAQSARVAELEALVAKLPTTADGVPVTPGMTLWGPRRLAWAEQHGCEYNGSRSEEVCQPRDYYSTRAAALAASQKSAMQGQTEAGASETSVK